MKPSINTLNNALTYHLEGMYDAEKRLQKCIPGCLQWVSSRDLKGALKNYLESAADKRTKLKRIFSYLLAGPFGRKNEAIGKMLGEVEDISKYPSTPDLRDTILAASLKGITAYKVSAYSTAMAFAVELGLDEVTDLLGDIVDWEIDTDKALSKIILKGVNKKNGVAFG